MAGGSPEQKIVVWYAVWAVICAAVAGLVVLLADTFVLHPLPHRSDVLQTLALEGGSLLAIAAGQGAMALVVGSVLAQATRALRGTVLLGILVGAFDFLFELLQVVAPSLEVSQRGKLAIALVAAGLITLIGARKGPAGA